MNTINIDTADLEAPLDRVSIGQLVDVLKQVSPIIVEKVIPKENWVHTLPGIANALGWSVSKLQEVKDTGIFDDVLIQDGRSISLELNGARRILVERTKKRNGGLK